MATAAIMAIARPAMLHCCCVEPLVANEPVVEHGLAGSWTIDDDVGGICNY